MAKYKAKIRIGLMVFLVVCVILCPLAWGGYSVHYGAHAQEKRDDPIEFTPHVTEIVLTVTPESTALDDLRPQPSPVPLAPTTPEVVGTPEPTMPTDGGDETVGYAQIRGSEPPMWRIWFGGEELYISPDDPAASVLLTQFMIAAEERSTKIGEAEDAEHSRNREIISVVRGIGELVLGSIVSAVSCSTVPVTFWVAGGTGWACAAGIGSIGVGISEINTGRREIRYQGTKYTESVEAMEDATNEAQLLFKTLSNYSD